MLQCVTWRTRNVLPPSFPQRPVYRPWGGASTPGKVSGRCIWAHWNLYCNVDNIQTTTIIVKLTAVCFRSDGGLVWCVHLLREFNRPCQRVTVHWSDTHDYFHIHSFTGKPQKLWSTESSKCGYRFVTKILKWESLTYTEKYIQFDWVVERKNLDKTNLDWLNFTLIFRTLF